MLKATNILWDTDYDDDGELPTEIDIPEGMTDEDEISDYLSEVIGYCHQGYVLEEKKNAKGIENSYYQMAFGQ